ncbi:hypothetical protein HX109_01275 [Galbibacter sp. BG1]|uniref:hypothetical protein n=1 Tax=Galbibacter sp. BG1 TaxID=1170699 RepID=UPI0015BF86D9|nr:hypothetical protein [Galbibacter sp. BG1]QLE00261.1 hypothetical protein HX109_01275 [Galbibacter sp. BG1]
MKKIVFTVLGILGIATLIYFFTGKDHNWSQTETLKGYDSEAAAKETPVESFKNIEAKPQPTSVSGVNPAHGQPGHRCDIAVGAPLNAPTNNTMFNDQVMLNPAHGQPGHRCDIKVGDPLPTS